MVGVGGSGKTSTCKLAAFSSGLILFTLTLSRNYDTQQLLDNLKELYENVVIKPKVFLFNDSHVLHESFLEQINTLLTNGMIQGMYSESEKEDLMRPLRSEMKKEQVIHGEEYN